MLGLCERSLRSLGTASDVEWLLQHTRCRDQFARITAHALRRGIFLLGPAADKFANGAAKSVHEKSKLRSEDKDYLELME